MTTRRGEYKIPGGKLVAVQLYEVNGRLNHIILDGDFFIDGVDNPTEVVGFIEHLLVGVSAHVALEETKKTFPQAQFVGLTAKAIDAAIARARGEEVDSSSAVPTNYTEEETVERLSSIWNSYEVTVLDDDEPRSPTMHMALDDVIAHEVADGKRGPTLRFWQWGSNAVIIGLHQSLHNEVDLESTQKNNFTIVRRMTGGGAMFVEPGNTITYSLYVPQDFLEGLTGYEAYKRCDEWVLVALRRLGIDAHYKPLNDITSPAGKIGGAAQRKFHAAPGTNGTGCVLHHVTMAYDIDASKMLDVLKISREKMVDKTVKSAAKRVDPLKSQTNLTRDELCDALHNEALRIIAHTQRAKIDQTTLECAQALSQSRYATQEWIHSIE